MLTGRMPFQADTDFAMMRAQIEEPPPSPRESGVTLPPAIEAALMKALAKNPDQRFADAAQFTDAIREGMREVAPPAQPTRT
jgi:serine/threonine-protein kinase